MALGQVLSGRLTGTASRLIPGSLLPLRVCTALHAHGQPIPPRRSSWQGTLAGWKLRAANGGFTEKEKIGRTTNGAAPRGQTCTDGGTGRRAGVGRAACA